MPGRKREFCQRRARAEKQRRAKCDQNAVVSAHRLFQINDHRLRRICRGRVITLRLRFAFAQKQKEMTVLTRCRTLPIEKVADALFRSALTIIRYYCNPSVPLLSHAGNQETVAIYFCRAAVRIRVKNTQIDDSAKNCLGGG